MTLYFRMAMKKKWILQSHKLFWLKTVGDCWNRFYGTRKFLIIREQAFNFVSFSLFKNSFDFLEKKGCQFAAYYFINKQSHTFKPNFCFNLGLLVVLWFEEILDQEAKLWKQLRRKLQIRRFWRYSEFKPVLPYQSFRNFSSFNFWICFWFNNTALNA